MTPVLGPVDPPKMDRATLIRVMQLRDFQKFSNDRIAALADRAEAEFGRHGNRPVFEFTPLEKRIYAYFREKRPDGNSAKKSFMEMNLMLMARYRYFQWMDADEQKNEAERIELMRGVAADMKHWESVYMDFLRAAELPIPTMTELIREFDKMIEGFKTDATPKDIVRIDAFKKRMNTAIVAGEVQGAVKNVLGSFLPSPRKKSEKRKKSKE